MCVKSRRLMITAALFVFFCSTVSAQAQLSDRRAFEERLSKVVTLAYSPGASREQIGIAAKALADFAAEYPYSDLAGDAEVLPVLLLFMGASLKGEREAAEGYIGDMEALCGKYPGGSFSDFTCRKWRELQLSSGVVYIPYQYLPVYMQGILAMDSRDFPAAIDKFSLLKDSLDLGSDPAGMLACEVYGALLMSCKSLGQAEGLKKFSAEALERFPDNSQLAGLVKSITQRP